MIQDTENIQRHVALIPIDASKKDIEYKFIVDGEWKYAIDLPHRTDWRKFFLNNYVTHHLLNFVSFRW
jgi:hypothetical protein